MKIIGIIPARYASTRFPGKPLVEIKGKTMLQRVHEQCLKAQLLQEVIVATDDVRIEEHVKNFGGKVIMTASHHRSGTDRCHEVLHHLQQQPEVVINIQGDEPFIDPVQIDLLAMLFEDEKVQIGSLYKSLKNEELLHNPNTVKTVVSNQDFALYFSRSPIPHLRGSEQGQWVPHHPYLQHIGIYGYRSSVLKEIALLPPTSLEIAESLEQLRWLQNGYNIKMAQTENESVSIDTPEDLERVLKMDFLRLK